MQDEMPTLELPAIGGSRSLAQLEELARVRAGLPFDRSALHPDDAAREAPAPVNPSQPEA